MDKDLILFITQQLKRLEEEKQQERIEREHLLGYGLYYRLKLIGNHLSILTDLYHQTKIFIVNKANLKYHF